MYHKGAHFFLPCPCLIWSANTYQVPECDFGIDFKS